MPSFASIQILQQQRKQTATPLHLSAQWLSAEDSQAFAITAMGGCGVISVFANVCPRESHDLIQKALDGDFKGSFELQKKYIRLMDALFSDVNPIPVKAAMNLLGWSCGHCRLPLDDMSESGLAALKDIMTSYGLIK